MADLLLDIRKRLRLDTKTGQMFWTSPSKYHPDLLGKEAGSLCSTTHGKQYWVIQIDGIKYKRGRLVFFVANGRMPSPCIDHANGNSLDDRPSNLREATVMQNSWNHKSRKKRLRLPMGVRRYKSGNFGARISFRGVQIHLGSYASADVAEKVYQLKRKELYGQFA